MAKEHNAVLCTMVLRREEKRTNASAWIGVRERASVRGRERTKVSVVQDERCKSEEEVSEEDAGCMEIKANKSREEPKMRLEKMQMKCLVLHQKSKWKRGGGKHGVVRGTERSIKSMKQGTRKEQE